VSKRIDEKAIYLRMLRGVEKGMKAAEEMMNSENEDVKAFALDAFLRLCDYVVALIGALKRADSANPLARRARLGEPPNHCSSNNEVQGDEEKDLHGG
jgi:cell division septation protein DedD